MKIPECVLDTKVFVQDQSSIEILLMGSVWNAPGGISSTVCIPCPAGSYYGLTGALSGPASEFKGLVHQDIGPSQISFEYNCFFSAPTA